jgi:hypothetical protein
MQYLRVGLYELTGGTPDQIVERVRSKGGMLEVFQQHPGFVAYGIGVTDDEFLISISVWDSAEQADAATAVAAEWVAEHIEGRVELQQDYVGRLKFLVQGGAGLTG